MAASEGGFAQAAHATTWSVWLSCAVIIAGTIVGGIAIIEWMWPLFWFGVALFLGGCVSAGLCGVMNEVSEFGPPPGTND